jgi:hypothetical protein
VERWAELGFARRRSRVESSCKEAGRGVGHGPVPVAAWRTAEGGGQGSSGCLHAGGGGPTQSEAALCGEPAVGWHFCEPADPQANGRVERVDGHMEGWRARLRDDSALAGSDSRMPRGVCFWRQVAVSADGFVT